MTTQNVDMETNNVDTAILSVFSQLGKMKIEHWNVDTILMVLPMMLEMIEKFGNLKGVEKKNVSLIIIRKLCDSITDETERTFALIWCDKVLPSMIDGCVYLCNSGVIKKDIKKCLWCFRGCRKVR